MKTSEIMSLGPGDGYTYVEGMSLRDYFAGQALAGILSDPETGEVPKGYTKDNIRTGTALACYKYADAMIEEREK